MMNTVRTSHSRSGHGATTSLADDSGAFRMFIWRSPLLLTTKVVITILYYTYTVYTRANDKRSLYSYNIVRCTCQTSSFDECCSTAYNDALYAISTLVVEYNNIL